jgi:hypothetical protein
MPIAEDGSVVPDSFYSVPPKTSSTLALAKESKPPVIFSGFGVVREVVKDGSGSVVSLGVRVESTLRSIKVGSGFRNTAVGDRVRVECRGAIWSVIENLEPKSPTAVTAPASSAPSDVSGSTPTPGAVSAVPNLSFFARADAGSAPASLGEAARLVSLNEDREAIRDIKDELAEAQAWMEDAKDAIDDLRSAVLSLESRVDSIEAAVNQVKDVASEVKAATASVLSALESEGIVST